MESFVENYFLKLFQMKENPNSIDLAIGQPNILPSSNLIKELKKHVDKYTNYTDAQGIPELREEIKKKLLNENKINAEKVIITHGAAEAIFDTILAHLSKNSEVVVFSPHYRKYITIPELVGAKVKTVPLNKRNRPDLEKLEDCITKKTKMIIVNSPNNPTGVVYSKDEIKQILEIADKFDLIILSDEVYEKYIYEKNRHISPGKFSDNVITINSFSKSYGLPGLRLGYLAGSSKLVDLILKVHLSNTTCLSYASQKAAIVALKDKSETLDFNSFDKKRKIAMKILSENNIDFIHPQGSFYLYIFVNQDSLKLSQKLMKNNLLVMPSIVFGTSNAIRISYATDIKLLTKGLEILIKNLSKREK